jgi:two-component system response regulator YesN
MYQLLIVDDEVHAANGVRTGIEWNRFDISNVFVAYNIRQAKEIFDSHSIDLMICDIEMPQGNGIELLTWVKENHPNTESIFLTCHADFAYAKQALQLGSFDYLLKPIRYQELELVVGKAIQSITQEHENRKFTETLKHYYDLWSTHHPLLVERLWLDLINKSVSPSAQQIDEILQKRGIAYSSQSRFIPILISIRKWEKKFSDRENKIMEYALRNAVEHSFELDGLQGNVVQIPPNYLVLLLPEGHGLFAAYEQLHRILADYISYCSKYFYCQLSSYIGNPTLILNVHDTVRLLIYQDRNNVTNFKKVYQFNEVDLLINRTKLPNIEYWLDLLKQGSKNTLLEEVERELETLKSGDCNAQILQDFYHDFLQMVYYVIQLKGLQAHRIFSGNISPDQILQATRTVSNLQEWCKSISERAIDFILTAEENQTVVDRVKKYITENINKDLSRDMIAEFIYLSPDYLSRIFKKETGVTLNDYLIEERCKYAKDLLIQSDLPVSEIAASAGYTNFSHFSKMFKRVTGVNPLEFRKSLRR